MEEETTMAGTSSLNPTLVVVDDDHSVQQLVRHALADEGISVHSASTADDGLELVKSKRPWVVLVDIVLPGGSGLSLLQQIRELDRRLPVILITAGAVTGNGGTSESAIEAMMLGAYDYVLKPLDVTVLRDLVVKALEMRRLMNVPVAIPAAAKAALNGEILVGRSPKMVEVYKAIARVAPQDVSVLIRGESGTGKELVARAIYQHSARRDGPFLAVNCAAVTETLLESELFGHEKGSFTGAERRRVGKFEQCNGGTIFLDEVGDMSPMVQSKVLRLLQEQKFERVGGNETIATDVRIISATNRDLETMGADGRFRPELYYRLHGFMIELPPLRERGEDILLLLEHFLARFRHELGKPDLDGIAAEAVALLMKYPWPGNVREMQSAIRQALLNATGPVIVPDCLPEELHEGPSQPSSETADLPARSGNLAPFVESRLADGSTGLYAETVNAMEKFLITRVLAATQGNQSKAAGILGITRGKLRDRIASFGISLDRSVHLRPLVTSGSDDA
jgi:two-component system nitrogen regulation response regulator GlnG